MFISVLVTLCHLVSPGIEGCVEEIITDSTRDETLTMQSCLMGEAYVTKWKLEHPTYTSDGWRLAKWGCRIGNKPSPDPKGRA